MADLLSRNATPPPAPPAPDPATLPAPARRALLAWLVAVEQLRQEASACLIGSQRQGLTPTERQALRRLRLRVLSDVRQLTSNPPIPTATLYLMPAPHGGK